MTQNRIARGGQNQKQSLAWRERDEGVGVNLDRKKSPSRVTEFMKGPLEAAHCSVFLEITQSLGLVTEKLGIQAFVARGRGYAFELQWLGIDNYWITFFEMSLSLELSVSQRIGNRKILNFSGLCEKQNCRDSRILAFGFVEFYSCVLNTEVLTIKIKLQHIHTTYHAPSSDLQCPVPLTPLEFVYRASTCVIY